MEKRGFTLVELMTTVAIIVILVSLAIPMFSTTRLRAQRARAEVDLGAIKTASIMLHHDTDSWPYAGASPGIGNGNNDGDGIIRDDDGSGGGITGYNGPYLDEWNNDPWGNPYEIFYANLIDPGGGLNERYVITFAADGAVGGTDGDADIQLLITLDDSQ